MQKTSRFEVPTILTLFGITGDLVERKVLAALFRLWVANRLPNTFVVYGVARRLWGDTELRDYLSSILEKKNIGTLEERGRFVQHFFYIAGDFNDKKTFKKLAERLGRDDQEWRFCANKLFYLAVAPPNYTAIITNLNVSGLTIPCSAEEGWTRVILEKPFGADQKSARAIEVLLSTLFKEEQIYRLDHYLGRETVRNIIAFRFSNSFLSPAWNNTQIEKIEISLFETLGAVGRGEFYDKTGAFLDVGQNHLLQLLALFTMDNPGSLTAAAVRQKRAEALRRLPVLSNSEVLEYSARGRYATFLDEPGVSKDSNTETYFKLKTKMVAGAFKGVPVYFESGKGLSEDRAEIKVTFKHPSPCLCPPGEHLNNVLHYHLKPDESITMRFFVKAPGHSYALTREDFGFKYTQLKNTEDELTDYEQLLLDIVDGDQMLFTSSEEVALEWRFAEPVVEAWKQSDEKILEYAVGEAFSPKVLDDTNPELVRAIGVVGLGKMGASFAENILEKGWKVVGYNRSPEKTKALVPRGLMPAFSLQELVNSLPEQKVLWLMLPAGEVVDETLFGKEGLVSFLKKGDIIIDAGNSFYEDSVRRGKKLAKLGIQFLDVGFSGGPNGARHGACFMVGGTKKLYEKMLPLLQAAAVPSGVEHFEGLGAGHFVKMIHNGIEYGMMQALAEGFTILKKSKYKLDLEKVAEVYNHGSVIESRLVEWLRQAFELYGADLKAISGAVDSLGEGAWTVKTAHKMGVADKVIHEALLFRYRSKKKPSFMGQIVSAMRGQFGGHPVLKKKK